MTRGRVSLYKNTLVGTELRALASLTDLRHPFLRLLVERFPVLGVNLGDGRNEGIIRCERVGRVF